MVLCVLWTLSAGRPGLTPSASFLFRPAWFPYAVTGVLQAGLLAMCIAWKSRQARLGIDDFGRPLVGPGLAAAPDERTALLPEGAPAREGPAE